MKLLIVLVSTFIVLAVCNPIDDVSHESAVKRRLEKSGSILTRSAEIAALGRVADLGDLYDARSDNFVEISLYTTDLAGDAIHTTDNAYSSIDYVKTESFSEKIDKLGVDAGLGLSVLSGLVKVSGSGKYLSDEKKTANSVKTSLVYSIRTVRDDLKIFSKTSRSLIDDFLLTNIDATHVVVGIEWGADVVLSLEETSADSTNSQQIQAKLDAAVSVAVVSVSANAEVDIGDSDVEKSSTFSLHINGDIIPNTVPQTINESVTFIRSIPQLIEKENGGKGKIMKYILMPLTTVQSVFLAEGGNGNIVREIQQGLIDQFMQIFQELKDSELQINDVYNAINTWSQMVPESDFQSILSIKSEFDSFANNLKKSFSDVVVGFRSGNLDENTLTELIQSYEESNWTAVNIAKLLDAFKPTMHKIGLMNLLQEANALFIDRRTDKYKILTDNYKQEVRVISVDLSIDISSPYVRDIVKLLEAEAIKESDPVTYYIEDAVEMPIPEVNAYLEGNVIKSFPVDKKEYILISDYVGKVIIIDAATYEEVINRDLPEIGPCIAAVVDNIFYNIDTRNGEILSTPIEGIMISESTVNWTQVGSFPVEQDFMRNSVTVNGSSVYFVTYSGILYSYDTISRTVSRRVQLEPNPVQVDTSLVIVDNILYIHAGNQFYSFDGSNLKVITTPEERIHCGIFKLGSTVCRVGGNTTDVYPDPVNCYDPSTDAWNSVSYINECRRLPGVVATQTATYIFGGKAEYGDGSTSKQLNSVEVFNHETKTWSYIPSPLRDGPVEPQAVSFIL